MKNVDHPIAGALRAPSDDFLSMLESQSDWLACSKRIRQGLPAYFINDLSALIGIRPRDLAQMLEIKTSSRRRWAKYGMLNSTESDYLYRTAVVINYALKLFEGDKSALREWLIRPALALGQKMPAELLTTFVGLRMVETLVWRLEYGVIT